MNRRVMILLAMIALIVALLLVMRANGQQNAADARATLDSRATDIYLR